jgi:2'-5' RNA ligase
MIRTFIAVNVSDTTRRMINTLQMVFRYSRKGIRFVPPENVHVTLKFLGDIDPAIIPELTSKIETSIRGFRKFDYICAGTGVFPNVRRPRVLWLGITQGSEMLTNLSKTLDDSLKAMPIESEERAFKAHITLGRIKEFRKPVPGLNQFLEYPFEPIHNPVDELILFKSTLTPYGAIYTPLHNFLLSDKE